MEKIEDPVFVLHYFLYSIHGSLTCPDSGPSLISRSYNDASFEKEKK